MRPSTVALGAGFAVFLAVITYLVVASLSRREALVFPPTPPDPRSVPPDTLVMDTITLDARDPSRWVFFDFDRQSTVMPPDTAGWDLGVRRFYVIAAGGIADLGKRGFDAVLEAPDTGYVANTTRGDTLNPAIRRWYRYSITTHLLEPNGHVYAVRTRGGRHAKIEILSYYCPGLQAGCLTFRYAYHPAGRAFR